MSAGDTAVPIGAGARTLSRGQDYLGTIARTLGDLRGLDTVIHELIQNADDAPGATQMRLTVTDEALHVWNDGVFAKCDDVTTVECAWLAAEGHLCDFHSFRLVGSGDKRSRPGTTGAFGIGFTAVYQLTDRPELLSNGEHWIVDEAAPHDERIRRLAAPRSEHGTTFVLPWATHASDLRRRLRQEPLTLDDISGMPDRMRNAVPRAMPFLKHLQRVEVVAADGCTAWRRRTEGDEIVLTGPDGVEHRWLVLRGAFSDDAAKLKAQHPTVVEAARSPDVSVAIPTSGGSGNDTGRIYATLPTEESVHLPVLVNADFYPASDRKRIRFDDAPEGEWNRAAIGAAATALASSLDRLPTAIGNDRLASLLIAARELNQRANGSEFDESFGAFWSELATVLPDAPVVPAASGAYGTPRDVRLWNERSEVEAAGVLRSIGIELVDPSVRDAWYRLHSNEVGIENLNLGHVTSALEANGLTLRRWNPSADSPLGGAPEALDQLWRVIDVLLSVGSRNNEASRLALRRCSIAPTSTGHVWTVGAVLRASSELQDLLDDVGVDASFLDAQRLGDGVPHLLAQFREAAATEVLDMVVSAFARRRSTGDDVCARLLEWAYEQRKQLDDRLGVVAALPIYPTAGGRRPLTELALRGDFEDRLGLAGIVELRGIEDMRPFLERLGAERLSLAGYCTRFLAPAIERGDLSTTKLSLAAHLLAKRLSEVRDDPSVRVAVEDLDIVHCTDGGWRRGSDVYLRSDLADLVGDDVHVAVLPTIDTQAHRELYLWLGAAEAPRPADVHRRCQLLTGAPTRHREIATSIVEYVARLYNEDPAHVQAEFAPLRDIAWLPTEGDSSRGYRPDDVHLRARQSLFSTQARFIDISRRVENSSIDFLRWLGLGHEPTPDQVVHHLLEFAGRGKPVGEDMWIYLDSHASHPALDALIGGPCLLLRESGVYVRPDQVYWRPHPFGRWRHTLAEGFSKYRALLGRLDVPEQPEPSHAVDVLLDIAAHHDGEPAPLLRDDVLVVGACWRLLSDGLVDGSVDDSSLADLTTAEVVLDARDWLRTAKEVYFRDSQTLADRFDETLQPHLIDRPDGAWRAMAHAGVTNLSDAVTTEVVEQTLLEPGGVLPARLQERHRLLVRVLSYHDHVSLERLAELTDAVAMQRLGALSIQQSIDIAGRTHTSRPFERGALYLRAEGRFLWVDPSESDPSWLEIARELLRALAVDGPAGSSVASVFRGVLGAASFAIASQELDELGYPALDASDDDVAQPGVTDGFGGTDPSGDNPVDGDSDGWRDRGQGAPHDGTDSDGASQSTGEPGPDPGTSNGHPTGLDQPPSPPSDEEHQPDAQKRAAPSEQGSADRPGPGHATPRQSRLRSYVVPSGAASGSPSETTSEIDSRVDAAAVAAVLAYERQHGRTPEEMSHSNPGYDIRSETPSGEVRYIEIKGTAARWGDAGVALSRRQYLHGEREREGFWLYVVEQALTSPQVRAIQDPVSQIDQYVFDGGWRAISETADVPRPALPPLRLAPSRTSDPTAVPFRNDPTDTAPTGWVAAADLAPGEDWFAVRIEGFSLGMGYHGGIALVRPLDRAPEEDDLVLVTLDGQIDPDSGRATSIRLWAPEIDLEGRQLALRLRSIANVPPLTVTNPDRLVVLGEVVGRLDAAEVEAMGYV